MTSGAAEVAPLLGPSDFFNRQAELKSSLRCSPSQAAVGSNIGVWQIVRVPLAMLAMLAGTWGSRSCGRVVRNAYLRSICRHRLATGSATE